MGKNIVITGCFENFAKLVPHEINLLYGMWYKVTENSVLLHVFSTDMATNVYSIELGPGRNAVNYGFTVGCQNYNQWYACG